MASGITYIAVAAAAILILTSFQQCSIQQQSQAANQSANITEPAAQEPPKIEEPPAETQTVEQEPEEAPQEEPKEEEKPAETPTAAATAGPTQTKTQEKPVQKGRCTKTTLDAVGIKLELLSKQLNVQQADFKKTEDRLKKAMTKIAQTKTQMSLLETGCLGGNATALKAANLSNCSIETFNLKIEQLKKEELTLEAEHKEIHAKFTSIKAKITDIKAAIAGIHAEFITCAWDCPPCPPGYVARMGTTTGVSGIICSAAKIEAFAGMIEAQIVELDAITADIDIYLDHIKLTLDTFEKTKAQWSGIEAYCKENCSLSSASNWTAWVFGGAWQQIKAGHKEIEASWMKISMKVSEAHAKMMKVTAKFQEISASMLKCVINCPKCIKVTDEPVTEQIPTPTRTVTPTTPAVTETAPVDEGPIDCAEVCDGRGYSTTKQDYSSQILSMLNSQAICRSATVSGGSRTITVTVTSGGSSTQCVCYDNQEPSITPGEEMYCRGTACGDVKCNSEAQCSCGENCVQTVTCRWGGWREAGTDRYTPTISAAASQ